MKLKAYRDLKKLKSNESDIGALLNGLVVKRWILLCPFLDDKSVVEYVGGKAKEILNSGFPISMKAFMV
jgi:hypothetical protein